jgi:drug/metabolite transporter (DMT)-like permease
MNSPTSLLGIIMAFTSAVVWGGADFTGGLATRKSNQFHVLALSALSGLGLLVIAALVWQEGFPTWSGIIWSMLAGVTGSIGIVSLYKALSIGQSAVVAPTSAVIGAGLPVIFGFLTQGLPTASRLIGFLLAFIGIWIVSQSSSEDAGKSQKGFFLACLAGFGFAGFMILISQVDSSKVFTPMIVERTVMFACALIMLRVNKIPFPSFRSNPIGLLAGILDVGGNIFFMLAKQFTRLDTAVVISSLYPASTVILTSLLLKEHISKRQWLGVVICLTAIILITA